MIIKYISEKLNKAKYKIIDDGEYFGEIPGVRGVWACEKTLEKCRQVLGEVLEEWLILKLKDGDKIPEFETLSKRTRREMPAMQIPHYQYA